MQIEISIENLLKNGSAVRGSWEKELNPTPEENDFLNRVLPLLPADTVKVERRSDNYLSIIYDNNDFLRFKITPRTKWLSLNLPFEMREEYKESPLFSAQKKKSLIHWKAILSDVSDVDQYKDLIIASCRSVAEA